MVNKNHLRLLKKGSDFWNDWRKKHVTTNPELSGADLSKTDLSDYNLFRANLSRANLMKSNLRRTCFSYANLTKANLSWSEMYQVELCGANLSGANLTGVYLGFSNLNHSNLSATRLRFANLNGADLQNVDLRYADLKHANLNGANLKNANLCGATLVDVNLIRATLVNVDLSNTTLMSCKIFGISTWGLKGLQTTNQSNLLITDIFEPSITVDNLDVAQFIYLLLHSEKIRDVLDAITSKVVLILGRFTVERKAVLDCIKDELRKHNYLPVMFDFDKPNNRDLMETVSTLAHMARFVIADITDARSVPQELTGIVPNLPSVPVIPILLSSSAEYGMFEHFKRYNWVLDIHQYDNVDDLLKSFNDKLIASAEEKFNQINRHINRRGNGKEFSYF